MDRLRAARWSTNPVSEVAAYLDDVLEQDDDRCSDGGEEDRGGRRKARIRLKLAATREPPVSSRRIVDLLSEVVIAAGLHGENVNHGDRDAELLLEGPS